MIHKYYKIKSKQSKLNWKLNWQTLKKKSNLNLTMKFMVFEPTCKTLNSYYNMHARELLENPQEKWISLMEICQYKIHEHCSFYFQPSSHDGERPEGRWRWRKTKTLSSFAFSTTLLYINKNKLKLSFLFSLTAREMKADPHFWFSLFSLEMDQTKKNA